MMHYFDPATPMEESLDTLDTLVQSGNVRYLGRVMPGSCATLAGVLGKTEKLADKHVVVQL